MESEKIFAGPPTFEEFTAALLISSVRTGDASNGNGGPFFAVGILSLLQFFFAALDGSCSWRTLLQASSS